MSGRRINEYRCMKCNALLFRGHLKVGTVIEIVCRACRHPKPTMIITGEEKQS